MEYKKEWGWAVSYTHLDVYKRQVCELFLTYSYMICEAKGELKEEIMLKKKQKNRTTC